MDTNLETPFLQLPATGYLRAAQVLKFIPIGKTCWWEGVNSGRFPKGIKWSSRCTVWKAEDIRTLIQQLSQQDITH